MTCKRVLSSPLPAYPEVTILRIHIPPGATLPLHEHPVINAGVLLKGELTVTTQDRPCNSRPWTPSWRWSTPGISAGTAAMRPLEIIVLYAGFPDERITTRE